MACRLWHRTFLSVGLLIILNFCKPALAQPSPCQATDLSLCLLERFQVSVEFSNFEGNSFSLAPPSASGPGHAVRRGTPGPSDADGFFWFLEPDEIELYITVLDARPLNNSFWVFATAATNVEYLLRVTDTQTGASREYLNPPGGLAVIFDTGAFPQTAQGASYSPPPTPRSGLPGQRAPRQGAPPPCEPLSRTLSLLEDRLRVEVEWLDFVQNSGCGRAEPLTPVSGAFQFFGGQEDPIELLVKAVDGRTSNGSFWIFLGSLSNVEYRITVTDTQTGIRQDYFKRLGATPTVIADNFLPLSEAHIAQFGGGVGFTTDVILFNTSPAEAASVELRACDEMGGPLFQLLGDDFVASELLVGIPPDGALTVSSLPFGDLELGSLRISSNLQVGVQVRYAIDGIGAAAVGPGSLLRAGIAPVRRQEGGVNTGLAVLNSRLKEVEVRLTLRDASGSVVEGGMETRLLAAKSRFSKFIHELFPDADTTDFLGTVLIESDEADLGVIALELGGAAGDFTSISVTPLP